MARKKRERTKMKSRKRSIASEPTVLYNSQVNSTAMKGKDMINIKPVTDLRSYTAVLEEVQEGSPVYLTKNGRGRYVILDIRDLDRMNAEQQLFSELEKGVRRGEDEGWIPAEEITAKLDARFAGVAR